MRISNNRLLVFDSSGDLSSNRRPSISGNRANISRRRIDGHIRATVRNVTHPRKDGPGLVHNQSIPRVILTDLCSPAFGPASLIAGLVRVECATHGAFDLRANKSTRVTAPAEPVLVVVAVLRGGHPNGSAVGLSRITTHVHDEISGAALTFLQELLRAQDDRWRWVTVLVKGGATVGVGEVGDFHAGGSHRCWCYGRVC
ncbi:hypothetical protein AA313_de0204575 [Arthrobotrys entomopaga]|nr:hypothetical protein AA313_de0204575 [Arthrobotrys entomopaga]